MKLRILIGFFLSLFAINVFSETKISSVVPLSPIVTWSTYNQEQHTNSREITIQNGTAALITVTVQVDQNGEGINIRNCGNTTHVDPGSLAVCITNDMDNFVSFTSDNANRAASGTYQITREGSTIPTAP